MVMNHEAAPEQTTELSNEKAGKFRRIAALMNYVAQDRPDMQVAVNHLCSDMSKPTQRSWTMLKRICRYLKKHQRVQYVFEEQDGERGPELTVYSDSLWAGCRTIRKSRSGGMILMSGGLNGAGATDRDQRHCRAAKPRTMR